MNNLYQLPDIDATPIFAFVVREKGIDEKQTAELGYPVPKLITFIQVVPWHHKGDPLEFEAEPWLAQKRIDVMRGVYQKQWVRDFEEGLKCFKEAKGIPETGTPLVTYERIAKDRREQLAYHFKTLEELASIPDSALDKIGMDGRVLRDLARAEVQAKKDLSPVVQELADAKEVIRRQEDLIANMEERLAKLETKTKKREPVT